jgi:hypothetical protein
LPVFFREYAGFFALQQSQSANQAGSQGIPGEIDEGMAKKPHPEYGKLYLSRTRWALTLRAEFRHGIAKRDLVALTPHLRPVHPGKRHDKGKPSEGALRRPASLQNQRCDRSKADDIWTGKPAIPA